MELLILMYVNILVVFFFCVICLLLKVYINCVIVFEEDIMSLIYKFIVVMNIRNIEKVFLK